ncbi:MAG: S-layer homology domain-containing protein, partial [Syntrophomonas sp.]
MRKNPKKFILLLLSLLLTFSLAATAGAQSPQFSDIAANDSNSTFITYLVERNILSGFPDRTFHPTEGLTRAQAAVVMAKAAGLDSSKYTAAGFGDVGAGHWAAKSIAAAAQAGYIKGFPDGSFHPEEKLTRAQGISLVLRIAKQPVDAQLPALNDIKADHWAASSVATGLAAGMVGLSSDSKNFLPDVSFTRAELARALGILLTRDPGLYQTALEGKLQVSAGTVTVEKKDKTKTEVKSDAVIEPGDSIVTGSGARAALNFPDGSSLLLRDNTRITVKEGLGRSYIKNDGSPGTAVDWLNLSMEKGSVFAALATRQENKNAASDKITISNSQRVNNLLASFEGLKFIAAASSSKNAPWWQASDQKKVKIKVDMPWGAAAVRGTFVSINVDEAGKASVACLTGDAEISGKGPAGELTGTISIPGGTSSSISAAATAPSTPAAMNTQQVQQFAQEKGWMESTAQNIDRNQEAATTPAPSVSVNQAQQPAPVVEQPQQQAPAASPASTADAVKNALDSASSSASPASSTNTSTSSGGGGGGDSNPIVSLKNVNAAVLVGQSYEMPTSVTAVRRNGVELSLPVTWSITQPDTSVTGLQNITGIVQGFQGTANLNLAVECPLGQPVTLKQNEIIYLAGGIRLDLGDLVIPEGATVTVNEPGDPPTVGSDLAAGGKIIDICFEGISITQPVELTLPVTSEADAGKAAIYYYNESSQVWEYQSSQTLEGAVEASVNHFSIYGVLLDQTPPQTPVVFVENKTGNSISLSFSAADNVALGTYGIYRDGQLLGWQSGNSYEDTGLTPGTAYSYQVKAKDIFGNESAASEVLQATTLSNAAMITGFTVPGQVGDSIIDANQHTVVLQVAVGTDLSALTPQITVSEGASISPATGTARDFSEPAVYTVTAVDGSQQTWTINITPMATVNAGLQALSLAVYSGASNTPEPVTLTPNFSGEVYQYTASVGAASQSLKLSFTADSGAGVTVNGQQSLPGEQSVILALNEGTNTIEVVVTGADGTSTRTYTITVEKAAAEPVLVTGSVKDIQSQVAIDGASVKVFNGQQLVTETTTSSGQFNLQLAPGRQYSIVISKEGYISSNQNVDVSTGGTNYLETSYLQLESSETGSISGTITDALTGEGVAGLTINFRPGMNTQTGTITASATSGISGFYELSGLAAGTYTGEVTGGSYTISYFTAQVVGGQANDNQNATVTHPLSSGQTRIVLTWGENPSDLDSHLTGPGENGSTFHIYYSNPGYYLNDGTRMADLDVDDTSSYGPETTTIYNQQSGVYTFYVYNYSQNYGSNLSNSGAQVKVYRGDSLAATFNVPGGSECLTWKVFELNGDTITPKNEMSNDYPGSDAYSVNGGQGGATAGKVLG